MSDARYLGAQLRNNFISQGNALANRNRQLVQLPVDILRGTGEFVQGVFGGAPPKLEKPKNRQQKPQAQAKAPAAPRASSGGISRWNEPPKASPFEALVRQVSAANGGQISLREMQALAGIAQSTAAHQPKPPGYKDIAGTSLMNIAQQNYAGEMAAAQEAKASGNIELARQLQQSAVKNYQGALGMVLGSNPMEMELAERMRLAQAADEGE